MLLLLASSLRLWLVVAVLALRFRSRWAVDELVHNRAFAHVGGANNEHITLNAAFEANILRPHEVGEAGCEDANASKRPAPTRAPTWMFSSALGSPALFNADTKCTAAGWRTTPSRFSCVRTHVITLFLFHPCGRVSTFA